VLLDPPCDLPCRVRAVLVFDGAARCGGADALERLRVAAACWSPKTPAMDVVDVSVFVLNFPNEDEDNRGEIS
jgi:hypothetical protein